jgi:hypothetical protein
MTGYQPRGAINYSHSLQNLSNIAGTVTILRGPNVLVPPNANVYIRAWNNTAAGNVNPVYVGTSQESVNALGGIGKGNPITPNTEISFPIDNLQDIWVAMTGIGGGPGTGDGVVISIRANTQV